MRTPQNSATYSHARAHFAALLAQAEATREPVMIKRRGREDVALIAADELRGLLESVHLLRSPANAMRLLSALARARRGGGRESSAVALRRKLKLDAG